MSEAERYTLEIKWYPEGQLYVVIAPEWTADWTMPISEGKTYEEAAERGHEALEHMVEITKEEGKPLPEPAIYEVVVD